MNAVRLGDKVISYCKFKPSGPFIRGSRTTFIEGKPAIRLGDRSLPGIAITGSNKVFIDGRPAVRQKDKVTCGVIRSGSRSVFYG